MVDEVHSQAADTYYRTTLSFPNVFYAFGFSASPLDRTPADNLFTIGAIGPLLHEIPYEELVDKGAVSFGTVHMIPCKQNPSRPGVEWPMVLKHWVIHSDARNKVLVEMAQKAEKPALMFVDQSKHAKILRPMLEAAGLKCDYADGDNWQSQRLAKLQALETSQLDVLLCTSIFQNGIDVPKLKSVIVAGGKSSVIAAIQRSGRGQRTDADTGKTTFDVWDVYDTGQYWTAKHACARLDSYQSIGYAVVMGWAATPIDQST